MTVSTDRLDRAGGAQPHLAPLLEGKRLLITGVATRASIAFAVARMAQLMGAEILLTSFGRMRSLTERAARRLPQPVDVLELDATVPDSFSRLAEQVAERWEHLDGALHAIASAPPEAMRGRLVDASPESAELAFRTSAYSFSALARAVGPAMAGGGSLVALDFDASRAWPSYQWMGVAKAALESIARYLARELGADGIRVNLVSCGPFRTVAATGVSRFEELLAVWQRQAPLGWNPTATEAAAGPVCFLLSDLSRAISGEIVHVDGGFNAVAIPPTPTSVRNARQQPDTE